MGCLFSRAAFVHRCCSSCDFTPLSDASPGRSYTRSPITKGDRQRSIQSTRRKSLLALRSRRRRTKRDNPIQRMTPRIESEQCAINSLRLLGCERNRVSADGEEAWCCGGSQGNEVVCRIHVLS